MPWGFTAYVVFQSREGYDATLAATRGPGSDPVNTQVPTYLLTPQEKPPTSQPACFDCEPTCSRFSCAPLHRASLHQSKLVRPQWAWRLDLKISRLINIPLPCSVRDCSSLFGGTAPSVRYTSSHLSFTKVISSKHDKITAWRFRSNLLDGVDFMLTRHNGCLPIQQGAAFAEVGMANW